MTTSDDFLAAPPAEPATPRRREFSAPLALFMSFFSALLYRDVAHNWRGRGLRYLLLLLTICWLPLTIRGQIDAIDFVNEEAPRLFEDFPTFTLAGGQISINRPLPCITRDPRNNSPVFWIDTRVADPGQAPSRRETEAARYLVGRDWLVRQERPGVGASYDLSFAPAMRVDKAALFHWLDLYRRWYGVAFFGVAVAVSLAYRIVLALLYALIGLALDRRYRTGLNYKSMVRLSAVAMTPALILGTLLGLFPLLSVPGAVIQAVLLGIPIAYLAYGLRANSRAMWI